MKLTLNNQQLSDVIVTFNGIPTIYRAEGTNTPTALEQYNFTPNNLTVTNDDYMTLNGATFSFTNDYAEAVGNKVYIATVNNTNQKRLSAASLARAINNSSVGGSYNAFVDSNGVCIIRAKTPYVHGERPTYSGTRTIIPYTFSRGNTSYEFYNSVLDLNLLNDGDFISQMSKKCATNDVFFDISPILSSMTEDGKAYPYSLQLFQNDSTSYVEVNTSNEIYAINGYPCNQGKMFLMNDDLTEGCFILQNFSRGTTKVQANKTTLYVFEPTINLSIFSTSSKTVDATVTYLNSILGTLSTSSVRLSLSEGINDNTITLDSTFNNSFYVDVTLLNQTIRYNVIKPLKYTDMNQRIYFRNSYGGISFFDFSGGRTEERNTDKTTYMKNNFNLYREEVKSLNKVYSNELEYEVTLTSHLMDFDGIYTLYDLIHSHYAYTIINGTTYEIIITDFNVEETMTNNIYQASITYVYSANDTF